MMSSDTIGTAFRGALKTIQELRDSRLAAKDDGHPPSSVEATSPPPYRLLATNDDDLTASSLKMAPTPLQCRLTAKDACLLGRVNDDGGGNAPLVTGGCNKPPALPWRRMTASRRGHG